MQTPEPALSKFALPFLEYNLCITVSGRMNLGNMNAEEMLRYVHGPRLLLPRQVQALQRPQGLCTFVNLSDTLEENPIPLLGAWNSQCCRRPSFNAP
jgi:hypothetical protein